LPSLQGLKNIENIKLLIYLEKLNLSCNSIEDVSPLSYLEALTELDLHENYM